MIPLTKSEYEIIQMLAEGFCVQEICKATYRSRKTVAHHLHSVYKKLDLSPESKHLLKLAAMFRDGEFIKVLRTDDKGNAGNHEDVLDLVAQGLPTGVIAARTGYSKSSVTRIRQSRNASNLFRHKSQPIAG